MSSVVKPPNILIQTTQKSKCTKCVELVRATVDPDRYVVYSIETEQLLKTPWKKNSILLIIQDMLKADEVKVVKAYLDNGGKVLDFSLNIEENLRGYVNIKTGVDSLDTKQLVNILNKFEIETVQEDVKNLNSYGYLVCSSSDLVEEFLSSERLAKTRSFPQSRMTLDFDSNLQPPSDNYLPIKTVTPPNFDSARYLNNLKTTNLGKLLIWVPTISSSMVPFAGPKIWNGFTVVPERQFSGEGRGGNRWLSPPGCSMFSIQIFVKTTSFLGSRPSLIQHLVALAEVDVIRKHVECQEISGISQGEVDIGLKWPNDVYLDKVVKLGGVIVKSTVVKDEIILTIGCGLNLDNELPTKSVNQALEEANINKITREELLGKTFTTLEKLIEMCNSGHFVEVEALYYKYWIHKGQKVKIMEDVDTTKNAIVVGIDEFGFLKVLGEDQKEFTVLDDGNSFDMMEGLIRPRTR